MSKNRKKQLKKIREEINMDNIVDMEPVVEKQSQENKPTLSKGNYIIEVIDDNQVIKKIAVANAYINISKLSDGGMTIDLK